MKTEKRKINNEQAGAELGQAQLKLGLVCTNMINKISSLVLFIAKTKLAFYVKTNPLV